MRKHDWKEGLAGAQVCARPGCTVILYAEGGVWQKKKGAQWRRITRQPIPECAGKDDTQPQPEQEHGAWDSYHEDSDVPTWKQHPASDYVGNTPKASIPGKRNQPAPSPLARVREALERVRDDSLLPVHEALDALTTLEAALSDLMDAWHYTMPHERGPDGWRGCARCLAKLEGK